MKTLVTGASGFIGSVLVRELLGRRHEVRALVREGVDAAPIEKMGVEVRRGDLLKTDTLKGLCDGIDTVFHCAARVTDWGTRKQFYESILDATKNILDEAAGESGRFVYLSSIAALGMGRHLKGAKESDPARKSGVPYNDATADAEKLCMAYHGAGRIACTVVRPANVTGPGSVWVRDIFEQMKGVTGVPLIDGGRHSSSFVYVESLVDGIMRAGTMEVASGGTYHFRDDWNATWRRYITDLGSFIGKGPGGSVPFGAAWYAASFMERICNILRVRSPLTRLAVGIMGRDNDVDTSRAKSELGWKTTISYENAMNNIGEWVRNNYA
ncbi:MAG: NAD(P)-dependent oxidoreductase [Chrysiogenales bacterium]|nr:MAG: NAD(P)-dependent oxidoreductase [Chrysiogenales bacterium]